MLSTLIFYLLINCSLNKSLLGLVAISATASSMATGASNAAEISYRNGSTSAPKSELK